MRFYGFLHIPFLEEMYLGIDVDMDPGWESFRRFYGFLQIPFLEEMYLGIDVDMDPGWILAGSPLGDSMTSITYDAFKDGI